MPKISENTFEIIPNIGGPGALDLRGASPIVENNTFTGAGTALIIGPSFEGYFRQGSAPQTGRTIIANNTIGTKNGIYLEEPGDGDTLLARIRFKAEVRGNKLRGTGASDGYGVRLRTATEVSFVNNEISNYAVPMLINPGTNAYFYSDFALNDLRINNNRFSLEGARVPVSVNFRLLEKKLFVNAKNNYWGDPSGPFDNSNLDNLYNPRGRGLAIQDGIDYLPFIGNTPPPLVDSIRISVVSDATPPFRVNTDVTLNVRVDYGLGSAPSGRINLSLRDADGTRIEPFGVSVTVSDQNHSKEFPPIQIKVPEIGNVVTVEAELVPDGGKDVAQSNVVPFAVIEPKSEFNITCVEDVDGFAPCVPPFPIRGNRLRADVSLSYTYTQGNIHAEVKIVERAVGSGTVLKEFPLISFSEPPAVNGKDTKRIELDIPLRDALLEPKSELYVKYTAKNDAGKTVGQGSFVRQIDDFSNSVKFVYPKFDGQELRTVAPVQPISPERNIRQYFFAGQLPIYVGTFRAEVGTKNVTNWQVRLGDDYALDGSGNILHRYTPSGTAFDNARTNIDTQLTVRIDGQNVIPPTAKRYRAFAKLIGPGGITVAVDSLDVGVIDPPAKTVQASIPAGASQVAFSPIPVSLNFTSNQTAGSVTAQEFSGQFASAAVALKKSGDIQVVTDYYWKFIPLNRYWAIYDTLKNGTFSATISFTYNPATDFPSTPGFNEDSLVVAGLSPYSNSLEALPSTLNKATHTITTAYTKFFDTWVVASKTTVSLVTEVSRDLGVIPERFAIEQNYPNPFNPSTAIRFSLPRESFVTMRVFNLLGQEVETLLSENLQAGRYNVQWKANQVASGVYFYRIVAGSFVETRKMLLLR